VASEQMPLFGTVQPIENPPPGIHTMPAGAFVGATRPTQFRHYRIL
jgi:hypothetical protein